MLKGISGLISPELLKVLCEMGHGDEIVFADGNFPSHSCSQRVVREDGHQIQPLLDAVLDLFPLDTAAEYSVFYMETDDGSVPAVVTEYAETLKKHGFQGDLKPVERFAFYDQARSAYAVVATGERALYGNLILKKGTV